MATISYHFLEQPFLRLIATIHASRIGTGAMAFGW
jgi:hypothetical protein